MSGCTAGLPAQSAARTAGTGHSGDPWTSLSCYSWVAAGHRGARNEGEGRHHVPGIWQGSPFSPQQICEEGGGKGWTQPFFFPHETVTRGSADLIAHLPWEPHPQGPLAVLGGSREACTPVLGVEGCDEVQVHVCWATRALGSTDYNGSWNWACPWRGPWKQCPGQSQETLAPSGDFGFLARAAPIPAAVGLTSSHLRCLREWLLVPQGLNGLLCGQVPLREPWMLPATSPARIRESCRSNCLVMPHRDKRRGVAWDIAAIPRRRS